MCRSLKKSRNYDFDVDMKVLEIVITITPIQHKVWLTADAPVHPKGADEVEVRALCRTVNFYFQS